MMLSHTIPITVTKQQVLDFANLTGDNISIHVNDGVVQGGLILSMLPQWFALTKDDSNFSKSIKDSMTVKLECRFKKSLLSDKQVNITFNYTVLKLGMSNINWKIHDEIEYCSGSWIVSEI
jgi:hypothetical protein